MHVLPDLEIPDAVVQKARRQLSGQHEAAQGQGVDLVVGKHVRCLARKPSTNAQEERDLQ